MHTGPMTRSCARGSGIIQTCKSDGEVLSWGDTWFSQRRALWEGPREIDIISAEHFFGRSNPRIAEAARSARIFRECICAEVGAPFTSIHRDGSTSGTTITKYGLSSLQPMDGTEGTHGIV